VSEPFEKPAICKQKSYKMPIKSGFCKILKKQALAGFLKLDFFVKVI